MTDTAGLRAWLQYLRLDKYFEVLRDSGHNAQSLARLNDAELAGLGLPLGPRKKIQLNAGLILQSCRGAVGLPAPDDGAEAQNVQGSRLPVPVLKLSIPGSLPPTSPAAAAFASTGSPQPTGLADVRAVQPLQARRNMVQPQFASAETGLEGVNSTHRTTRQSQPHSHCIIQPQEPRQNSATRPAYQQPRQLQGIPTHPQPLWCPQYVSGATPLTSVTGVGAIPNTHSHAVLSDNHQANGRSSHHHPQQQQQSARAAHVLVRTADPWVSDTTVVDCRAPESQGSLVLSMSGINHLPTPLKQQDEGDKPPRQPMLNSAVDAGNASVSSDVGGHLASPGLAKFSPPTTNLHPTGVECYPTSDEGRPVAGAAAAERRALAQLYPSVARLHYSRAPGANIGHRTLGDVGTPLSSNADGVCVKSDVGDPEVIGVAGWLGSTRRGVLKRSRSWDGRTGSSPPCIATEAPKGGVQIPRSQYVQSKPAETCMQRQRTRWADGQLLYTAAASALPVDCSFRSLRNATTAAIVAAAATANGPSTNGTGTARSAPQAYLSAPSRTVAASVSGQAAVVIAGEDNMAKVATCAALSRPSHATAASAAGVGDNHPDAARLRSTQDMYGGVALTDADAGGVADATSLLDDPRNYETPELLAQLLYDSAPVVPGPIDATEFRVGNGRPAAPEQPPGNGMLQGSWARVAGEGGDLGGGLTAVDNDGPGGLRVSREQRLARLRALREEVTATERLLGTLRRMVAAEEKALASTTAGDDSSGGCASGVAPSRQASTVLQAHAHAGAHLHVQSHRHGTGLCSEQGDGLGV